MKNKIFSYIGLGSGVITTLFGGWKGLCRKCMTLFCVLIAVRLDLLIGTSYLRDAVCIAFIVNEAVSIIENAGLMGVPLPEILKRAIDVLEKKSLRTEGGE